MSSIKINFQKNYYVSHSDFKNDLTALENLSENLGSCTAHMLDNAANFLDALQIMIKIREIYAKLNAYASFKYSINCNDTIYMNEFFAVSCKSDMNQSLYYDAIKNASQNTLEQFFAELPELEIYRYDIFLTCKDTEHALSKEKSELVSVLNDRLFSWSNLLYKKIVSRNQQKIDFKDEKFDPVQDFFRLKLHQNRDIRKQATEEYWNIFNNNKDLIAIILSETVKTKNRLSKLKKFDDFFSENCYYSLISPDYAKSLLAAFSRHTDMYKKYESKKAALIKDKYQIEDVRIYDLNMPLHDGDSQFSFEHSCDVIRKSLTFLGSEYIYALTELFDPANGMIDLEPGENRDSWSAYFLHSCIFIGCFNNAAEDLSGLAHEAGHAIHYRLMEYSQLGVCPAFLAETIAKFNSLCTLEYALNNATDETAKKHLHHKMIDYVAKGFMTAFAFLTEYKIHEAILTGCANTENDFDTISRNISRKYSDLYAKESYCDCGWATSPLFITMPFYSLNYVISFFLSMKLFIIKDSQKDFSECYLKFLKKSNSQKSAVLLRKYFDIDLNNSEFDDVFSYIEKKYIDMLE